MVTKDTRTKKELSDKNVREEKNNENKLPTALDALRTVPRVSSSDWKKLSFLTKWLIATRAGVLVMTVLSSMIAIIWSVRVGKFQWLESVLVVIGCVLAHATNNLLNDYVDWKNGVDQNNYFRNKYGTHPMKVMSEREFMRYLVGTGLSALSISIILIFLKGSTVLYLSICGSFFLLFYTWPLKYYGLGEISVLIVWGYLMICGSFYTITSEWDNDLFWVSIPYSICVTCVLFGKHIDKSQLDREKGIRTIPVLLGSWNSRVLTTILWALMYIFLLFMILKGIVGWSFILVSISLYDAYYGATFLLSERPKERPSFFPEELWPLWYVAYCFNLTRSFGSYYLLSLILDTFLFYK